jgi:hypothetical protein
VAPCKKDVTPNVAQAIKPQVNVDIFFLAPRIIENMFVTLATSDMQLIAYALV